MIVLFFPPQYHAFQAKPNQNTLFPPMLSENLKSCCGNLTLLFVFGKTGPETKMFAAFVFLKSPYFNNFSPQIFPSKFGLSQGKHSQKIGFCATIFLR